MDTGQFDDLTRSAVNEAGTRRTLLQFLAGSALGSLVARLGLSETAEAKAKKRKQHKPGEKSQPKGELQAEGKRNGKKRGKKKPNKPKDPSPPPPCGPEEWRCADGRCIDALECCPEERRCGPNTCVPATACCSNEWQCSDGKCVDVDECCPDERRCGDGCVGGDQCCANEWKCSDGQCVPQVQCCSDERQCADGVCVSQGQCCPEEKRCPGYTECFAADDCCPNAIPPLCDECEKVVCENGGLVCRPKSNCCPEDAPRPVCNDSYEELFCCHGEWICRNKWDGDGWYDPPCYLYDAWLTYNPETCRCECPAGAVMTPGDYVCCPEDYPDLNSSAKTCHREWNDWVCPVAWSPDPAGQPVCSPTDWPPDR